MTWLLLAASDTEENESTERVHFGALDAKREISWEFFSACPLFSFLSAFPLRTLRLCGEKVPL